MTFDAIGSVRGMSDDELATANLLLKQLADKAPRNFMRASIYDGKRAIRQVGTVIPPQYQRLGMVLGWVPKGVDALGRRCTLERFTWADGDLGSLGADLVFDQNYLRTEFNQALTSSFIHAVSFLVNVQGEEDEPRSLIMARDAMNATGTWNRRRRALDDFISVTGRAEDRPTSFVLYLDGVTISAEKIEGSWSATRSMHPWGVPVEVLSHRARLGRPFGSSRMTRPAISAQDAGVREVMRLEGHMDVYSFPELLLLGADGSVFKDEDGNTLASWQQMVGRVKGIPDDEDAANPRASAIQIPASSPQPHLANLNAQAALCASELSLPESALKIAEVSNPTSAEAYDASQYELIAAAEGVLDDAATPLRRSFARALAIQNGMTSVPDGWLSMSPKYRNPKFLARSAEADAGAKQIGSVPWLAETSVGLELLGLTDEQIRRAQSERRRAQGTGIVSDLLQRAAANVNADDNTDTTPA